MAHGGRGAGAADCVREHREPAARARQAPAPRSRHPCGARREPRCASSDSCWSSRSFSRWRARSLGVFVTYVIGGLSRQALFTAVEWTSSPVNLRVLDRLGGVRPRDRSARRDSSGASLDPRHWHRRAADRPARRRRPAVGSSHDTHDRSGSAVGGSARRRRTLRAQPVERADGRSRDRREARRW